MPHDAALYVSGVQQRTSPADTAAANAAEVDDAQDVYASAQENAQEDYLELTDQIDKTGPAVYSVSPASALAEATGVDITVTGFRFVDGDLVQLDGVDLATVFVSSEELTTTADGPGLGNEAIVDLAVNRSGELSNTVSFTWDFDLIPNTQGVPTNTTSKPDIVAWLLAHGVNLDEGALDNLNKSELLVLVQALLDDD